MLPVRTAYHLQRHEGKNLRGYKIQIQIHCYGGLNDKWLNPYSDKVVEEKATEGIKKMLVFSPSFIADCLETTYEIGIEYNEIFKKFGGTEITPVESLNENPV